ncbi:MAG: hypothetical protein B6241_03030 [Spirochaetaceae bacterium 4572_59]|nr:MAG: hypothetical protein B6241_03030 [Spirochaetaceae bacterium 4572_59]
METGNTPILQDSHTCIYYTTETDSPLLQNRRNPGGVVLRSYGSGILVKITTCKEAVGLAYMITICLILKKD